jgi:hypothetical protein
MQEEEDGRSPYLSRSARASAACERRRSGGPLKATPPLANSRDTRILRAP